MMTIKEIAKESGYSLGTVSRVLNNQSNVSEKARQRILEVVRAHDYHPNQNARHLKMQAQSGIALIMKGSQNMLLAGILEEMQSRLRDCGYETMSYYLDQDDDEVEQAEWICRERTPFGLVFLGSNIDDEGKRLAELGLPCLLVTNDASRLNLPNVSSVSVDDAAATEYVIDYLCRKGHREIGVIGGDAKLSEPSRIRLEACEDGFAAHGLHFSREKNYAYSRFSMEGGYRAAEKLMEKYPEMTAVFCMSDVIAIGAIRALADHGLRVPENISVIGFDGIELARYVNPRLTTIKQDTEEMAEEAVEILMECIRTPGDPKWIRIPFVLQEGESVAVCRRGR